MKDCRFVAVALSLIVPTASACLSGCAAGYPPAEIETAPWNDDVAQREAQRKALEEGTPETAELEARLFLTEQGRVIARSIRAHGGWDAWLAFPGLSYVRTRVLEGEPGGGKEAEVASSRFRFSGKLLASLTCPCDAAPHAPHFSKRQGVKSNLSHASPVTGDTSVPQVAVEFFAISLPFLLEDPAILKEYLGVEEDLRSGILFEKVRCTWPSEKREVRLVAWFDRATWVLRRALFITETGLTVLVRFSQWTEFEGIKIPMRRDIYHLKRMYARWDPDKPVAVDILTDPRLPR